jgi:hypothetical protein
VSGQLDREREHARIVLRDSALADDAPSLDVPESEIGQMEPARIRRRRRRAAWWRRPLGGARRDRPSAGPGAALAITKPAEDPSAASATGCSGSR